MVVVVVDVQRPRRTGCGSNGNSEAARKASVSLISEGLHGSWDKKKKSSGGSESVGLPFWARRAWKVWNLGVGVPHLVSRV